MIDPLAAATSLSVRLGATAVPLVGVLVHGSATLGGWTAGRSDLDLLVIVDDALGTAALRTLVDALIRFDPDAEGMHLEASVVTATAARNIRDRWPFLAHINSQRESNVDGALADANADDPDLAMHYAVARHAGRSIIGPSPDVLIGPVPRRIVLGYLAEEMLWGLEYGSAAYALLNACRARCFLDDGSIVSKIDGGQRCLRDPDAPQRAIKTALAWQLGGTEQPELDARCCAFVEETAADLITASIVDQ